MVFRIFLKFFFVILTLLTGCFQNEERGRTPMDDFIASNGKIKVLSTTSIIDDLVSHIGGEYIDHISLVVGELDPHSYELVKGDDEKLHLAQIVFYNGLGLEHGASLHYRLQQHPNAISLGGKIADLHPERLIRVDGVIDPHLWMDLSLWIYAVDSIVETLSNLDPNHTAIFQQNGEMVREKMGQLDFKIEALLQQIPSEKRYLVTSHDAFNYFTKRYLVDSDGNWLERFAAPEGLSPESQLSTRHISQIVDYLALYQVKVLFPESNVSRDSLKKILFACREKGMEVTLSSEVLYGDAMGGKGSGAENYLEMMEHNAEVLFKEWQ